MKLAGANYNYFVVELKKDEIDIAGYFEGLESFKKKRGSAKITEEKRVWKKKKCVAAAATPSAITMP